MAGCAAITGASPDVMLKQWRAGWTALPGCRSTAGSAGTAAQRGRPPGLPDLPGPKEALGRLPGSGGAARVFPPSASSGARSGARRRQGWTA